MDTLAAITDRRSIRKFQDQKVPRESIEEILELAVKAPSGKNRQPWRFVVLEGKKKDELVEIMGNVIEVLNEEGVNTGSCRGTIKAIEQAQAIIFVFNAYSRLEKDYNNYRWLTDIQSIGGAIQTMILAAQDLGLGTLWICDVFYADQEICSWLNRDDELVAAVAIGYADESPHPRQRKHWKEITEWID